MAPYFLGNRTIADLLYYAARHEQGSGFLASARIVVELIATAPGMRRPNYFGMLLSCVEVAVIEHQVAQRAPGSRHTKLNKEVEQAVDYDGALDLTGSAKFSSSEQIARSPDQ